MAGQDLDQLSHEFRLVPERLVVRQLEGVLDPICTQRLMVIFRFGDTSPLRLGFEIFPLFSVSPGFFSHVSHFIEVISQRVLVDE